MLTNLKSRRIAFMGTSPFAVIVLNRLLQAGVTPTCVYTQPPRAKGRGMQTTLTAVGVCAESHELPLIMPTNLNDADVIAHWHALNLDAAIVVSYGMKLPDAFLNAPRFGCINVHPSILPRWRGAAPLERAIEAGDTIGGVSIIQMDSGIDTGPILAQQSCPISNDMNGRTWHDFTANLGANTLIETLNNLENNTPQPQPDAGACYAKMFSKASLELDFNQPANAIYNKIRAFAPKPGAWCWWGDKRLCLFSARILSHNNTSHPSGCIINKSLAIQTAQGIVQPTIVQLEGRKTLSIDDFLNGQQINTGSTIGHSDD